MNAPKWVCELQKIEGFSGEIALNEPLAKHTYFKIGAEAAAVITPKTGNDLRLLREFILQHDAPYFILGLGSNILAPDTFFPYLVVKTTKLSIGAAGAAEVSGDVIRTDAGLTVAAFLRKASSEGWDGFEFMSGIPGTIGGVVAMNGGTHLGEAKDLILSVKTFSFTPNVKNRATGGAAEYSGEELTYSYRKNHFLSSSEIVLEATWKLVKGDPVMIREKLDSLYRRRKETQPLDFPSCGSVFKNPKASNLRAWEVVDQLGLRGHRIGNAQFAEKHPNWILNLGGAKASDVTALIELAKTRAKAELGVEIQEEVKILFST